MSSAGEENNKLRPNRGAQGSQQQGQARHNAQSQRQNSPREAAPPPTNVWDMSERGKVQRNQNGPSQQQHVPVKGFATQDVQNGLKEGYRSATPEGGQALRYKATPGQAVQTKSGAWGQRASNMSTNKDLFVELRRQVTALQNTKERAGG